MALPFPKTTYVYHRLKQRGNVPDETYVDLGADVYLPYDSGEEVQAPEGGFPVFFLVHGGGFCIGDRDGFPVHEVQEALDRKWAVVTMDYPLSPAVKIVDMNHALQICNNSASGYLTLASGFLFFPRPSALISFYPASRFDSPDMIRAYTTAQLTGGVPWPVVSDEIIDKVHADPTIYVSTPFSDLLPRPEGAPPRHIQGDYLFRVCETGAHYINALGYDPRLPENKEKHDALAPYFNVDAHYPPTALVHGTADEVASVFQSTCMAEALAAKNVAYDLILIDGAPHVFDYIIPSREAPGWKESVGRAFDFAAKYV
ncbi:hypothetical protein BOTBODRAFT_179158 [Botryobasidium botryosum FD-172 SS1]|uniref:Peptidase S9 prolyl oligopeptidase catalytic domain-containing protein n=1 Tax=Botryobasidium botryosum (strain FD-172 SS1) TaxID=930990 RepID=A0A067M3M2_BOTB1|nr:hypothetical protein BOTBODRAFT_179158 [Botryobasidium botryosum FD-172 SS1]